MIITLHKIRFHRTFSGVSLRKEFQYIPGPGKLSFCMLFLVMLLCYSLKTYAQQSERCNFNLKCTYDFNFDPVNNNDIGTISSLFLTPSIGFGRNELYLGPLFSKDLGFYDYGHSKIRMGGALGYNFSIFKDPKRFNISLFYSVHFIRHYLEIELHSHGTGTGLSQINLLYTCNILGVNSKIFLDKKRNVFFELKMGYPFTHLNQKYETVDYGKSHSSTDSMMYWARIYASFGFNVRLATLYRKTK